MKAATSAARARWERVAGDKEFVEKLLVSVERGGYSSEGLQVILSQLLDISERMLVERVRDNASAESYPVTVAINAKEKKLEADNAEYIRRLDQAKIDARILEAKYSVLEKELAAEQESAKPRRLQAKVRELWPTIESELEYFLEWYIEREEDDKIDVNKIVGEYVKETKK